jgi:cytochrome c biogenesis protein CcdA
LHRPRAVEIIRRVISWLLLGFAMGLRHSLEADHVAAVASLSARSATPRELVRVAGAWGVGHALTLLAVALLWAATAVAIPDPAQPYVEIAAGLLLAALGVDLLRRREAGWARVRPHRHPGGTLHVHLHFQAAPGADELMHRHPHHEHPLRRALLVGSVHGLAGSALIGLGSGRPAPESGDRLRGRVRIRCDGRNDRALGDRASAALGARPGDRGDVPVTRCAGRRFDRDRDLDQRAIGAVDRVHVGCMKKRRSSSSRSDRIGRL